MTSRHRLRRRGALAAAVGLLSAGALAGCSAAKSPGSGFDVRLPSGSCTASTVGAPPVTMSVEGAGSLRSTFVPVCIEGHGPYPFELDTGAGATVIDAGLARQLALPSTGAAVPPVGVGCVTATRQVFVPLWSLGHIALSGQAVMTAPIPGFGDSAGRPAGVLGGDVLSRFGAIRLDYRARQMTPLAPEGPAPSHASLLIGDASQPPPPLLVHGAPQAVARLTVLEYSGVALSTASTSFAGSPAQPFLVDTGAAVSAVAPALASSAHLAGAPGAVPSPVVGCRNSVGEVRSGAWQAGSQPLAPQDLALVAPPRSTEKGVMGWLGADVLRGYGSVVLDYRTGLLWLGTG